MITKTKKDKESQPSIISFVKDIPNLCSLAGLACTILAIYFSILSIYDAAMIGMIWAVAFDWADGLIAQKMKGRTENDCAFGGHLDGLIDIVNYGVAPAILLMSYGKFKPIFLIGAFFILATSAIRLSHFSTFGLSNDSKYTGLSLDNNSMFFVFLFIFESVLNHSVFSVIFYVSALGLATLNVSQIKTLNLSKKTIYVYVIAVYTLVITGIYGWKLFYGNF